MQLGDTVRLHAGQRGRIIGLTDLFGRRYADMFIEPAGPVRRVPLDELRQDAGMDAAIGAGALIPAPLFIARVAAHQLQALMTQQGVLSAANFRVSPLPHQVLAVDFVLGRVRPRVMIADEVGLGKTIEAAIVYEELKLRRQAKRCLVIAPAGLTRQWQDELAQKFGEQFVVHDSMMMAALRQLHGQEANLWAVNDQVITSLDFVKPQRLRPDLSPAERERREAHNRRIFQDIVGAGWDVVIFDEAHKLSKQAGGSETARYRVCEALASAVPVFLLLTATPHQGDAGRFLHLLNLLDTYGFNQVADLTPDRVATVVWRTRKRTAVDTQGRRLFKQRVTDIYPVDRSGTEHATERELYEAVTEYVRDNYNRAMGRGDRAFGFLMILFQRLVTSSSEAIYEALRKRRARLAALGNVRSDDFSRPGHGAIEVATTNNHEFDEEAASDEDAQAVLDDLLGIGGVVNEAELVPVFVDRAGASHPRLARSLLNMTPEHAETGIPPPDAGLDALRSAAQRIADAPAADRFSKLQLGHAEQLADEREKLSRYYRQQEAAVAGIVIENIRQAKLRQLLERQQVDREGLTARQTLVPNLELIGTARLREENSRNDRPTAGCL